MQALLTTFRWRLRAASALGGRLMHICDSQVCVAVACKGRPTFAAAAVAHALECASAVYVVPTLLRLCEFGAQSGRRAKQM
eukprot:118755-Pyramimonas_sp.AAC.1